MRMKSRRTLAILLSMVLLLALAPSGFAVDLDPGKNSVTVECVPKDSDFAEDLATATIQVDLYLLAPAKPYESENVDSYTYEVPGKDDAFYDLVKTLTDELNGTDTPPEAPPAENDVFNHFEHYAQDFAKIVLDSSYTPDPDRYKTATAVAGKTFINVSNLDAGLYLLIIRGADLTEKADSEHPDKVYVKRTGQTSNSENAETNTILTTRVLTDDYEYLFRPQLFTLPTKLDDNVQQYNTAFGTWNSQLSIYAKPTRESRLGDLKIIKNLNNAGPDRVDFVFEVSWEKRDGTTFNKYISISFEGESRKEYVLEKAIPIGTSVTVNEVYTGLGYTLTAKSPSEPVEIVVPSADGSVQIATVEFTNDHGGPGGGHGVVNRFTAIGNNAFAWSHGSDSAAVDQETSGSNS